MIEVLILLGRDGTDHIDRGNSFMWHLLARAFTILVFQVTIQNAQIFILCFLNGVEKLFKK